MNSPVQVANTIFGLMCLTQLLRLTRVEVLVAGHQMPLAREGVTDA
jgi:hypothetical protein